MKDFTQILKESIINESKKLSIEIIPESPLEFSDIEKFLKKEKIKFKKGVYVTKSTKISSNVIKITFDDKLQKEIILNSLKKDLRVKFKVV